MYGTFFDAVGDESYSGVPVNWVEEERTSELDPEKVSRLIGCGKIFHNLSWGKGTSGNLSFRADRGIGVTATRAKLGKLTPEDIIKVTNIYYNDEDVPTVCYEESGDRRPTTEVLAHWELYRSMQNIEVILHGHDARTTEMAPFISAHSPDLTGRTKQEHIQGTKAFADALKEIAQERRSRRYLISQGHGFFSLGRNFEEALGYAETIHYIARIAELPAYVRHKIDFLVPQLFQGMTIYATDRLEGLVKAAVKLGVNKGVRRVRSSRLVRMLIG